MTGLTALFLGASWAAVVLAAAARHRPLPVRVHALVRSGGARPARTRQRADVRLAAGRLALRLVRRHDPPADVARQTGGALIAAAGAAAITPWPPVLPVIVAAAAWWWPRRTARRQARRRAEAIARAVPDAVDLFLLAVDAGLTVPLALRAVAHRTDGPLGAELECVTDQIDLGRRAADALDDLAAPQRAGEAVRPLVAALVASERYGAPLASGLVRLADDARRARRRQAEETARRLPVTLLFPLVTCTLPAFGLLTVGPLVVSAVRSLRL